MEIQNRRSGNYLQELEALTNVENITESQKKRLEWEQAVTAELELLDSKQNELELKVEALNSADSLIEDPSFNVQKSDAINKDILDKLDVLTENLKSLQAEYKIKNVEQENLKGQVHELSKRVKILENESDDMIQKQSDLKVKYNDLVLKIVEEKDISLLKSWVIKEIDAASLQTNNDFIELKNYVQNITKTNIT